MSKLPIIGKGLDAIIRDTTKDQPERVGPSLGELEKLRVVMEELSLLRSRLDEKESIVAELTTKTSELSRIIAEEMPQGAARELYVETLMDSAAELDKNGNLLDAFHLYRRALRLDPKNTRALYEIAAIYFSAALLPKAAECLRAILELEPGHERAADSLQAIEYEMEHPQ